MLSLKELLKNGDAMNGTKMLLLEIRKHQKDMPAEVRDDLTFGALLVLFEQGTERGKKLTLLNRLMSAYAWALGLLALAVVALHSNVPWLTALLERVFGG